MKYLLLLTAFLAMQAGVVQADYEATEKKLQAAMSAEVRSERERARDRNRRPVETLAFFGLRDNMKVVELIPGGGWYTKLLAPVLADRGELIVALGTDRVEKNVLTQPGFEKVTVTGKGSELYRPEGSRFYELKVAGFNVKRADMVLTFRNYHNFNEAGRRAMNKLAYDALKKGGIYGVVDHTQRHMEPDNPENRRRIDPVLTIKEIQEAGFELVDFSDLHYRPDDELRYEVGRRSVTGNSDRFTLMFKKK
ncbi:class I SAM-dependent methyltransferase [Exilibacterium tricleocarpae]|uniref:Class I SAM-dependent methyltransferase n=1 Tax=Exilibacterium tricleocarpae TaxID=2591008 RepID=A0A545ST66_9GAMM|nr:class I SAM-dependent methyltransferase [Exilibacterium tricleocarpae]TQV68125.1 class I SAM-dependent methyltransferase [Exilibacterium tricleocarpae]